jgi:hypothetical protein
VAGAGAVSGGDQPAAPAHPARRGGAGGEPVLPHARGHRAAGVADVRRAVGRERHRRAGARRGARSFASVH